MTDLARIGLELYHDREFALRFQGSASLDTLLAYFTSRGATEHEAIPLAQAYVAGSKHAGIAFERMIDRSKTAQT